MENEIHLKALKDKFENLKNKCLYYNEYLKHDTLMSLMVVIYSHFSESSA